MPEGNVRHFPAKLFQGKRIVNEILEGKKGVNRLIIINYQAFYAPCVPKSCKLDFPFYARVYCKGDKDTLEGILIGELKKPLLAKLLNELIR